VPVEAGSAGVRLAGMEKTAQCQLNSTAATRQITTEVSPLKHYLKSSTRDHITVLFSCKPQMVWWIVKTPSAAGANPVEEASTAPQFQIPSPGG
jgi:hypothetical protein